MSSTPFASGAPALWQARLGWPIPSAFPFEKHPPVTGVTGRHAPPSNEQMESWMETHADSNLLLRVRPDVIGIDVDAYDGKSGDQTLATLTDIHGSLPHSFRSSARDMPSGIYYYRLAGYMEHDKMRDPGEHIEVIRHTHRYAVVPPSWHQGAGANYGWDTMLPHFDELPKLPDTWYVHLTRGCECFEQERAFRKVMMSKYRTRPPGMMGRDEAEADLEKQLDELAVTTAGSRNERLSQIAGRTMLYDVALNGVLDVDYVTQRLFDTALIAGLERAEIVRTIESATHYAERVTKE